MNKYLRTRLIRSAALLVVVFVFLFFVFTHKAEGAERLQNNFELLASLEGGVKSCPGVSRLTGAYRLRSALLNLKGNATEELREEHKRALVACRTRNALLDELWHCPSAAGSPTALLVRSRLDEVHYGTFRWNELMKGVTLVSRVCSMEVKVRMHALEKRMQ